jgi:hypothetical protein
LVTPDGTTYQTPKAISWTSSARADAPAHDAYFIVEVDGGENIRAFMLPILKLRSAEITLFTDFVEEGKRKAAGK